jgi:uncharacterized protein YggE
MVRSRTQLVVAIAIVAMTAGLAGCNSRVVAPPTQGILNTVTANGEGKSLAAPDQAEMTFGVTTQGADAKKTLDDAAKQAEKIVAALKKAGVDAKDLQTSGVSLYPQQDYQTGKTPRITGYQASIQVRATIKDIAKTGDVITAAVNAGATDVGGPTFTLSEQSMSRTDAINKAVADARVRAEAMAKAAGKSLGEVVSISEAGVSAPPIYYGDTRAAKDAMASVPIETGTLDVVANVTVVFELK